MYVADWQADNAICIHLWKYCVYCHWVRLRRLGAAEKHVKRRSVERQKAQEERRNVGAEVIFPGLQG
jgi:hypothetical protein